MNETEHTPGPWEWEDPLDDEDSTEGHDKAMIRLYEPETCRQVLMVGVGMCYLHRDDNSHDGMIRAFVEVSPADARLIAEAPMLLAACKAALGYLPRNNERSEAVFQQITDVIAKTKGAKT